jgi:hypothetical protein
MGTRRRFLLSLSTGPSNDATQLTGAPLAGPGPVRNNARRNGVSDVYQGR